MSNIDCGNCLSDGPCIFWRYDFRIMIFLLSSNAPFTPWTTQNQYSLINIQYSILILPRGRPTFLSRRVWINIEWRILNVQYWLWELPVRRTVYLLKVWFSVRWFFLALFNRINAMKRAKKNGPKNQYSIIDIQYSILIFFSFSKPNRRIVVS